MQNKKINEAMNRNELFIYNKLINVLGRQGFRTFANYLSNFHINFLTSKQAGHPFVAAINPEEGIILINPELEWDEKTLSVLIRHEIGHHFFQHRQHTFYKLKQMGIDNPSDFSHQFSNIIGDRHISNEIYDKEDMELVKNLKIDGRKFEGIVTELDFPEHPEYWTMDFDQLWDVFSKELNPRTLSNQPLPKDYIEAYNKIIDLYNEGKLSLDDVNNALEEISNYGK